ncbi:MAG: type II toxin-antitoxin system VapC family toxin [Crocosphaera sp.]
MNVVLDANFIIAAITPNPFREAAEKLLKTWENEATDLHAPELARYEIANALTRSVSAGIFLQESLEELCNEIAFLPIIYHPLTTEKARVVEIALSLSRRSAYDAAYLALADNLKAELWTLDGPLSRNAMARGFNVQLLRSS